MAVWSVVAFDDHTVVTGCADKSIRIFDLRQSTAGEVSPSSTIHTPDVVRALCRSPSCMDTKALFTVWPVFRQVNWSVRERIVPSGYGRVPNVYRQSHIPPFRYGRSLRTPRPATSLRVPATALPASLHEVPTVLPTKRHSRSLRSLSRRHRSLSNRSGVSTRRSSLALSS
ncbi:hypothetical protein LB505_006846 [Fusarium chuoi]|nr:hypothetical protein LB505_006846 [Fusarium chuoi]